MGTSGGFRRSRNGLEEVKRGVNEFEVMEWFLVSVGRSRDQWHSNQTF